MALRGSRTARRRVIRQAGQLPTRGSGGDVEGGPTPAIHGVVRWRLKDLAMWVWEEFRVSVSETTVSRILRALGYRRLSARPRHHAQAAGAVNALKKRSPSAWTRSRATRGSIATG